MGKRSKAKATSKSSKKSSRKGTPGKGGASAKAGAPSRAKVTPDRKLSGKAARIKERLEAGADDVLPPVEKEQASGPQ